MREEQHDFSRGSMLGNILRLSLPLIVAQFINVLYNIVDRMYIGRIPGCLLYTACRLGSAVYEGSCRHYRNTGFTGWNL